MQKDTIMETNRQLASHIATLAGDIQQDMSSLISIIEQRMHISYEVYTQFKADRNQLRQLLDRMERQIDVAFLAQSIPHVASPDSQCAWCWVKLHPDVPYPPGETSGICADHTNWVCRQAQARKASESA